MAYKFKKGCEVEVWNNREVSPGSWWCAEILSGNGHTYSVKYHRCMSDMGEDVERVPRKAIRPCPPHVKSPINWVPGDTVEVFDNYSWKTAEVTGLVGRDYFRVRFLGSPKEFRAHLSELRLRQAWQDGTWVMIGKNSEKQVGEWVNRLPKEENFSHQMVQPRIEGNNHLADNHFTIGNDDGCKELQQDFTRGVKIRPHTELSSGVVRKRKAVEEERRCQRLFAWQIPKLQEKVVAVASPQTMLRGKYMRASLNNRTTRISEAGMGKNISNVHDVCYYVPSLESSDTESTFSSVGSCGTHNSPYRLTNPINGLIEDLGSHSDDAGTSMSRSEPLPPTKEAAAAEIHRLELHAYRTTLEALHASGPISWEQEALISNLRLMLNISTDEHLVELRNLVPVGNYAPFR